MTDTQTYHFLLAFLVKRLGSTLILCCSDHLFQVKPLPLRQMPFLRQQILPCSSQSRMLNPQSLLAVLQLLSLLVVLFMNKVIILLSSAGNFQNFLKMIKLPLLKLMVSFFVCFGRHVKSKCTSGQSCDHCKGSHHTLLHLEPQKKKVNSEKVESNLCTTIVAAPIAPKTAARLFWSTYPLMASLVTPFDAMLFWMSSPVPALRILKLLLSLVCLVQSQTILCPLCLDPLLGLKVLSLKV